MSVRNRLRRLGRGWRATPLSAIAMLVGVAVVGWGCAPVDIHPAVGSTTPLGTYMRPAKAPDCAMPVLESTPNAGFEQVAIVDAWDDFAAKDSELIPILKR